MSSSRAWNVSRDFRSSAEERVVKGIPLKMWMRLLWLAMAEDWRDECLLKALMRWNSTQSQLRLNILETGGGRLTANNFMITNTTYQRVL